MGSGECLIVLTLTGKSLIHDSDKCYIFCKRTTMCFILTYLIYLKQSLYTLCVLFISSVLLRESLPGHWDDDLDEFQKLLVLRCIRADKVTNAMQVTALVYDTHIYLVLEFSTLHAYFLSLQDFVSQKIGQRFIEPQTADLSLAYKDSSPTSPLIFILSVGKCSKIACLSCLVVHVVCVHLALTKISLFKEGLLF